MKLTEKQLRRAIYSTWDIQQALSALTFLMEDCDFEENYNKVELRRFRCYETTLIISLARPFEKSRNGTVLSLKSLGIRLLSRERELIDKILFLRRKIVAHSDEEEMHFRTSTFSVFEGEFEIPEMQFDESLHLNDAELHELEHFLRRLLQGMVKFFFELAQKEPAVLQEYKIPISRDQLKDT